MSRKFKLKKAYAALVLSVVLGTQVCTSLPTFAQEVYQVEQVTSEPTLQDETLKQARYLEVYFGLDEIPEVITWEFFANALAQVGDPVEGMPCEGEVTYSQGIQYAVKATHFEELARVYSQEKVEMKGLDSNIETSPYIACALDTGLIESIEEKVLEETMTKEECINLLMSVAQMNGKGRHFLGYTNEETIYTKLIHAFESAPLYENEKLQAIGAEAVLQGITTGYNLLNSKYSANFLPELTLRYGHSTLIHATQLVGLLQSEGIVAKVQLEPKTSIFEYLPEWGPIPPATPNYRVDVVSDELMLANSLEYDLVFEFETEEEKIQFDALVEQYAKKNDTNQGEGLLFASWWQPLYVSPVEMGEGYQKIYNNVMVDGDYSLNPFCLEEDAQKVLEGIQAIDETIEVNQVPIWCNDAFYRYLTGTSHQ